MSRFHRLKVVNINRKTPTAVTVTMGIPDDLKDNYTFKAGQYITLKTILGGEEVRRDYSICSAPNSGEITVAVKEVKDGLFSKYINQDLKVGDVIEVTDPNGRFIFEPNASLSRNIVAFTAGSGITPIMSIIKTVLTQEPQSKIHVLFGNSSKSETIFYNELVSLAEQFPGRFNLKFIFSQEDQDGALFGRIDRGKAFYFLNSLDGIEPDLYYLCGPEQMIYTVSDALTEKGINKDKIKFELFTIKLDSEETVESSIPEGKTEVTIMLDDEETTFIMDADQSVLGAALKQKLDPPYSCQGGICSSCIARISEGEVKMRKNSILTDGEIEEGLVLTCQSHPVTPKIYINYDDV